MKYILITSLVLTGCVEDILYPRGTGLEWYKKKYKEPRVCSKGELFIKDNTKYKYRECIE